MPENEDISKYVNGVLLVLVVAVIILTMGAYTNATQNQIETYVRYAVGQSTQAIANEVDAYLSNSVSNIRLAAQLTAQSMSSDVLENAQQILEPMLEQTPFSFMEYIDKNGRNTTGQGEAFDASGREYYREGIQGHTGIWINYHPRNAEEFLLNFYTPLYYAGEPIGVLTGILGAESDVLPLLHANVFGVEMIGLLCDENGRLIASTRELSEEETLEQLLQSLGIDEAGQGHFLNASYGEREHVFSFSGVKGTSVGCTVVNERTGWRIIQIVPEESFRNVVYETANSAYQAIGIVVLFLAAYLVYVVFSARQKAKLKDEKLARQVSLSYTDRLTGLSNRRAYEEDLADSAAIPEKSDLVYVSADVNGLKKVNDTLGHAAGDELIRGAAECLSRCLGAYGRVYRIGGDEFAALIFAGDDKLRAIERDLNDATIGWHGETVKTLTVSFGFARRKEYPGCTIQDLAQKADEQMYRAKALYYSSPNVDRRKRQSAYSVLCASYTKILNVNLTVDTFQIVSMEVEEKTQQRGFSDKISVWLHDFGTTGQVHPDDLPHYLAQTDIQMLRQRFHHDKSPLYIHYRRNMHGEYRDAVMEMIPTENYSEELQLVYLYVKGF